MIVLHPTPYFFALSATKNRKNLRRPFFIVVNVPTKKGPLSNRFYKFACAVARGEWRVFGGVKILDKRANAITGKMLKKV